jgi:predicted HAD superfamily hydrolase
MSAALYLSGEDTERLKSAEITIEMDAVVPIAENTDLVDNGGLLLSDMYLGEAVICQLLERAGLTKRVELVVTSDGKHFRQNMAEQIATFFD